MNSNNFTTYYKIYNELYLKIINGEYKEGDKLPTEEELCKQYFASRITVRKALEILVQKGYLIRKAGKGSFISRPEPSKQNSEKIKIGVIICNISSSYGLELLKSIENHAAQSGFNIILRNSYYNKNLEMDCLKELSADESVKGIILQPVHNGDYGPEILNLLIKKYPLVLMDRYLEGVSFPFVGTDNAAIIMKVMNYLFEMGHRNIGFFSSNPANTSTIRERYYAVSESFSRQGLANNYNNHFFKISSTVDRATPENIASDIEAIKEHLRVNPHLTCIICAEFAVYHLLKSALAQLGLSVPQDLSVLTFDNISDSQEKVSYIKQNEDEMGKIAVELLAERIFDSGTNTKIYISADFISYDTIKDLRKN